MKCTTDVSKGIPLQALMSTLKVHGRLVIVALPEDELPRIHSSGMFSYASLMQCPNPLSRAGTEWMFHWREPCVRGLSNVI